MNHLLKVITCFLIFLSYPLIALSAIQTYVAKGDVVVMEAESAKLVGPWRLGTEVEGYTGEGYIYSVEDGIHYQNDQTILAYNFKISTPGDYKLIMRVHYSGEPMDLENDCWTKMDDGKWVKTFNHDRFKCNCNIGHDRDHTFTKPPIYPNLKAGAHTFYIAARSENFRIDRIHLYHQNVPASFAEDHTLPILREDPAKADARKKLPGSHTYMAISDFDYSVKEYSPSYVNGQYLAIDPLVYGSKPAAAELTYNGKSGTYNISITTLAEFDGESQYVLMINDTEKGTFQTDPVPDADSEEQQTFSWKNIEVERGDTIRVLSYANSNGIYPEEGAPGGFAWSRARWSKIELSPLEVAVE